MNIAVKSLWLGALLAAAAMGAAEDRGDTGPEVSRSRKRRLVWTWIWTTQLRAGLAPSPFRIRTRPEYRCPNRFADGKWSFTIAAGPGNPKFTGALSADGKKMTGDFSQGSASFPFSLTRTGDPKVETPKSNPAVAKEFLGTWNGTLEAGQSLRLMLKIENVDTGGKATLTSVDQGGAVIPVSEIQQKDANLTLLVSMVNGDYKAEISKDGTELNGTWSQNGSSFPLKLTKKAPRNQRNNRSASGGRGAPPPTPREAKRTRSVDFDQRVAGDAAGGAMVVRTGGSAPKRPRNTSFMPA